MPRRPPSLSRRTAGVRSQARLDALVAALTEALEASPREGGPDPFDRAVAATQRVRDLVDRELARAELERDRTPRRRRVG